MSLGGVSRFPPLKRVRAGLAESGRARIHDRNFSVPVVVYPIIGLALSMRCSTRELLRCLLEGFKWLLDSSVRVQVAGKSATPQTRSHLGAEPLRQLYTELVRAIADKRTPTAWYRNRRLMSLDSSRLAVADTQDNEKGYGRAGVGRGESAFPKIRFVALLKNGTHVLWASPMGAFAADELTPACSVVPALGKGMLCLADRFFPNSDL
ncbi:MAG: transposase domain-containing protein [Bryobacteraceae bacterium]